MTDKELLNLLGLHDKTISLTFDEDYQRMIEHKVDRYLKQIEEEEKKKKQIEFLKNAHEEFLEKKKYADMISDNFVYGKVKNKLIQDGFIYRCKYCWGMDVSGQYGQSTKPKNRKD